MIVMNRPPPIQSTTNRMCTVRNALYQFEDAAKMIANEQERRADQERRELRGARGCVTLSTVDIGREP